MKKHPSRRNFMKQSAVLSSALMMGGSQMLFAYDKKTPMNTPANDSPVIRLARLQIDASQLDKYKAALREEVEASVRVEPGVLTLYAVQDKNHPDRVVVFEIYANQAAYDSHIQTPHFKKYKDATQSMVKSLELNEMVAVALKSQNQK
ncbi:MAG: antibiotic biosynthesis monooxygenase [Bacteroidetes bacterium]|nr:antibiotic biosynthesis monooxygenase [Bacteroidota bacterium]